MRRPWTFGRRKRLKTHGARAWNEIVKRVRLKCAYPPLLEGGSVEEKPTTAWGQYLDDYHYSKTQWGIYGTSAALQILALHAIRHDPPRDPANDDHVKSALPMPLSRTAYDERLQPKVDKGDLNNIVKLAFLADAACLGASDVNLDDEPALVKEMIDMSVNDHYWSSRLENDVEKLTRDIEFPTAVVLYALRRYKLARAHSIWRDARDWLAETVTDPDEDGLKTPTMYAVTGLALVAAGEDDEPGVAAALVKIDDFLLKWSRSHRRQITLTRPVYNGFAVDDSHDYIFLHPELLTALYFMERDIRKARSFILRVVDSLCKNTTKQHGFEGQARTISTIDQLWAMRVLDAFQQRIDGRFFTRWQLPDWVNRTLAPLWARLVIAILIIAVSVYVGLLFHDTAALSLAIIFGLAIAAAIEVIRRESR